MKHVFVVLLLCCMCAAPVFAQQEKSALPLPDSGNVTLTLDEYNKLVELAAKPPKKSDLRATSLLDQACRRETAHRERRRAGHGAT